MYKYMQVNFMTYSIVIFILVIVCLHVIMRTECLVG